MLYGAHGPGDWLAAFMSSLKIFLSSVPILPPGVLKVPSVKVIA